MEKKINEAIEKAEQIALLKDDISSVCLKVEKYLDAELTKAIMEKFPKEQEQEILTVVTIEDYYQGVEIHEVFVPESKEEREAVIQFIKSKIKELTGLQSDIFCTIRRDEDGCKWETRL